MDLGFRGLGLEGFRNVGSVVFGVWGVSGKYWSAQVEATCRYFKARGTLHGVIGPPVEVCLLLTPSITCLLSSVSLQVLFGVQEFRPLGFFWG